MKISIITISFNRGKELVRTIESVYRQNYDDIEYIVVDGGSTDETIDHLKHWENRFDGRMKYISESDSGVYNAINKGIKMATGDVVGILNSEDYFNQNDILTQVAMAFKQQPDLDLVYGDIHYVDRFDSTRRRRYYSGENFRIERLRCGYAPPHPSLYCKRDVYTKYGLYNEKYTIAADFDIFVRFLWIEKLKSQYLPLDMVAMRLGGLSTQWRHRLITNTKEKHSVLVDNGIFTTYIHLMCRYPFALRHYFKNSRQFLI